MELMGDQNPSPGSSSTKAAAGKQQHCQLRRRRHGEYGVRGEADGGDSMACTGKSCQSCTAGAIADCVAVCCCPCAVVNLLALALLKLPWAVARRYLRRLKQKQKKRIVGEERKWLEGDMDGILRKTRACGGIGVSEEGSGKTCAWLEIEEIWYEVGHLGFGRVSVTGADHFNDEG